MTHRQILVIIFALMAGMFLSALDQTIVGTSIRTIADDLNGLALQAWVTTAYLILSTISTPIYGKLSDIFGRRPLFIIAISVFLIGSLLAGLATSMYELAVFRGIQGLGAGGLMALPLTIMGDMLAPRQRAKYQGYFLATFGIASVIGPLIGGLLSGSHEILFITGWRWVFLINIPIGVVALAVVLKFLHLPHTKRAVRIDWWGAATVILALVPLLLIAEQGREWGWFSAGAWACYVLSAAGIVAFIFVESRMGDDALIPLKLFKNSTFSVATVLGVLVGFGMFGALLTVPLYLQLVQGATPTESGFLMLPMILGLMIASIVSGQLIARTGKYRIFPITGTLFMAVGFVLMTFLTVDRPLWYVMMSMFFIGLGLGQMMQTLTIASQNAVGPRDIGVATSASTFFRQIGGTLGTAVVFSFIFTRLPNTIGDAFADPTNTANLKAALADPTVLANPANKTILGLLQSNDPSAISNALDGDTSFLNNSTRALAYPFLDGFSNAIASVFWITLAVITVAFVLSLFLKATPLRQKSALQEASDLDARDDALAAEALSAANTMGALIEPGTSDGEREPSATVADTLRAAPVLDATPGTDATTSAEGTDSTTKPSGPRHG
ncbi:MDR family MFS transporter [Subtercola vilae]|uniref:DHA2 family efflux MFS transporter permease subunit n=1 Tax=Subtercola vilae TaxID=2056433 RepID=A0A4V4RE76_9MICO|nr:MDR family MFS transporter [Subtercola vilae]TIH33104.1 DHA2 family efflux MFS transporter permease subunit [Subtercola vilae]